MLSPKVDKRKLNAFIKGSLFSLVVFSLFLFVYTRNSTFPFWYHWDEEGKAAQIITNTRNMNHPLLLLNTAAFLEKGIQPGSENFQHVTHVGRITAAGFTAAAVICLSLLAWSYGGFISALLVLILVGGHPLVFKLAHFFKEDPALFFGWSAALLAARFYEYRPSVFRACLLGGAAALAVSGKYIGGLVLVCAFLFVLLQKRNRRSAAAAFLISAGCVFSIVNWQMLVQFSQVQESFQREVVHQLNNETGLPPAYQMFGADLGWLGLLILGVGFFCMVLRRKALPASLWLTIIAGTLYLGLLLFTVRLVPRYMLIPYVTGWWLIAWLLSCFFKEMIRKKSAGCRIAGWVILVGFLTIRISDVYPEYFYFSGRDTRYELARYIEDIAEPDDLVVIDLRVNLPGTYAHQRMINGWVPSVNIQPLPMWSQAMGEDIVEAVREKGADFIVIKPGYVDNYLNPMVTGEFGQFADLKWRRPFYEMLMSKGELVYHDLGEEGRYLAPELALYRIHDEEH